MMAATPLPGNPYEPLIGQALAVDLDGTAVATAVLALAHEQHQRNRLAAITAMSKGLDLPPDLEDLATEGVER